jgi:hypothetical protein
MRKSSHLLGSLLVTLALAFCFQTLAAQTKTVKIKEEKALLHANEFIITWEGDDYKGLYYEVSAILASTNMVEKQVFFNELQRLSVIVSKPWKFEELRDLFESHGFTVFNKAQPSSDAVDNKK